MSAADELIEATYGDLAEVRSLLERGADPNALSEEGTTALYIASVQGEDSIVQLLLEAGADPNLASRGDSEGLPMCAAASWGYTAVVQLLLDAGGDPNLAEFAHPEDSEAMELTPLYWAASNGHVPVVKALLAAGADALRDEALARAEERGDEDVAALLRARSSDSS